MKHTIIVKYSRKFMLVVCCFCLLLADAQDMVIKDSIVQMALGPQYKASHWKRFWWGQHYRYEWCLPNNFPVIDLDATAGGLTALERGGGHQTLSLRLLGANNKEYVLRTIDKSLDILIPESFKNTFASTIANDQLSTAHPYSPLVVAKLSAAIGLPHTNPAIVFVPTHARLREYAAGFANKLCLFEERASGQGWEEEALSNYADNIINSSKLFQKLATDQDHSVDQKAFLRARLFDILINDWDRHEDQWVWLAYKHKGKTRYIPLARDRDQAFSKIDGVFLRLLSTTGAVPSLQNLDRKVKNVKNTALTGLHLDRQFLNALDEEDWSHIIKELQAVLRDSVIYEAAHSLPVGVYKQSGEEITKKLISRRNDMLRFGMKYYKTINNEVDITGSDEKEAFTVTHHANGASAITVQHINKKGEATDTLYHRLFYSKTTKKIHLYGLGDEDRFLVKGNNTAIAIDIVGGEGEDVYGQPDNSHNSKRIAVYDADAISTAVSSGYRVMATKDSLLTAYKRGWYSHSRSSLLFTPSYTPDDGVFLGAEYVFTKHVRGKLPFASRQAIGGAVAFGTGATAVFYTALFKGLAGKWDLDVSASYRGPQYIFNFYGYGNNAKLETNDRTYNRIRVKQFVLNPMLVKTTGKGQFRLGLIAENLKVEKSIGKFIARPIAGIGETTFKNNTFLGVIIGYVKENKDSKSFPTRGYSIQSAATYKRNLTVGNREFINLSAAFTFYLPVGRVVIAHRSGGAGNVGSYDFYHANAIGGNTLRGYYRTRFTGRQSFYQNTELRLPLFNSKGYVFRGKLGLFGFFDDGRVWVEGEKVSKLHVGYGGGIFFSPFDMVSLNLSYAKSEEAGLVGFNVGFGL